jgi:hypothetical protein
MSDLTVYGADSLQAQPSPFAGTSCFNAVDEAGVPHLLNTRNVGSCDGFEGSGNGAEKVPSNLIRVMPA